jgi:hypothetical protein
MTTNVHVFHPLALSLPSAERNLDTRIFTKAKHME